VYKLLANYVPHTKINVKVYTTADEASEKPLKDIKVLLKENNEKVQEMMQNFYESLNVLEEQKKASMKKRSSETQQSMRLPPIERPVTSNKTGRGMETERPMTTASLASARTNTLYPYYRILVEDIEQVKDRVFDLIL